VGGRAADGRILSHPKSATQFHFGTVRTIQGGYGTLLMAACWPLSKSTRAIFRTLDGVVHLRAEGITRLDVSAADVLSHDFH
jgi:hypothetical protein